MGRITLNLVSIQCIAIEKPQNHWSEPFLVVYIGKTISQVEISRTIALTS